MADNSEIEYLNDRLMALEGFIQEFLPPIIAAPPARTQLEAQLRALSDQDTSSTDDPDLHWRATLAEDVLSRLSAG